MSTYPVLDNKPIDQWRVTELKEELKRRRLPVRGLKDDLIRRLDEALRAESETANDEIPAIDETESAKATDDVDETGKKNQETEKMSETVNESDNKNEETGDVRVESGNSKIELGDSDKIQANKDDDLVSHGKENVLEDSTVMEEESKMSVETTTVETAVTVSEGMVNEPGLISESVVNESGLIGESAVNETGLISESVVNETGLITESVVNETGLISESMVNETGLIGEDLKNETENKKEESELELELKIEDPESSDVKNQVFEVSEVKSESIYNNTTTVTTTTTSTNTIVSVDERNEQLKENIIADNVKLEFDVKPLSSENIIVDDGKLLVPMDSDDLQEEEKKKNEVDCGEGTGGDVGLAEKLNLERSSGEDSMEEDGLESKENNDSKLNSDERVKTGDGVNVDNLSAEPEKKIVDFESKNESAVPDVKRKFNGGEQESGMNNDNNNIEITKRQRRWNSEGQNLNISTNSTNSAAMPKRNFSRSDSMASKEPHKERVVPPSSKPSTTSLRIDRFLRPFTLKAVQELLGKTGSVTSFWMDNIKTHCYVTYSSVEEAEETRNAVYNLQWPPNGGRLLVAEFVDPQEVKTRVEAPPPSPATPSTAAPPLRPPPPPPAASVPSPRLPMQRQQLPPPPSLPPPPPPPQLTLPPPPPLPERVLPPIVTLDDLFRKTKATPRIYYLPLTDEQVEHKAKMAQGKIATAN